MSNFEILMNAIKEIDGRLARIEESFHIGEPSLIGEDEKIDYKPADIVTVFVAEMAKHNPGFKVKNEKKWKEDARKLHRLGYDFAYLRELIEYTCADKKDGSDGKFEGWAHWCRNIDTFRKKISKIEDALDRDKARMKQQKSSVRYL